MIVEKSIQDEAKILDKAQKAIEKILIATAKELEKDGARGEIGVQISLKIKNGKTYGADANVVKFKDKRKQQIHFSDIR